MAFVRVKSIKKNGQEYRYAYLVSSRWKKRNRRGGRGSRQKVMGYLGRVLTPERVYDFDLFEQVGIDNADQYLSTHSRKDVLDDLVGIALLNHGFSEEGGSRFAFQNLIFDFFDYRFYWQQGLDDKGKPIAGKEVKVAVAMHEGFLCHDTLKRVWKGKFLGTEREVGLELAKAFVLSGLAVPQEIFVGYFEKVVA